MKRRPTSRGPRHSPQAPSYASRRFDVVAVGASAGGLHALSEVLGPLPPDFPASIVIVQHLDPHHKSMMSGLLSRYTKLQAKQAEHGELLLPGVVYIAPPDEHLLVGPGIVQLAHTRLVHYSRPSIDLLFESVAGTYGTRSIGVVLTGSNSDGAAGIRAIKEAGGTTVVQEPTTAEYRIMPAAAVATGCVDMILGLQQIGEALSKLCSGKHQAA